MKPLVWSFDLRAQRRVAGVAGVAACVTLAACSPSVDAPKRDRDAEDRTAIATVITQGLAATRSKNVDVYLDQLPDDVGIKDSLERGVTREQIRAQVLAAWEQIVVTRALEAVIDTIIVRGDSANVVLTVHWDRLLRRPDGSAVDTVVSTKKQQEVWRRTPKGWRSYHVTPLGSSVQLNGRVINEVR